MTRPSSAKTADEREKSSLIANLITTEFHRTNASVRIIKCTKNPGAPVRLYEKRVVYEAA
jgi:hypothetical protein